MTDDRHWWTVSRANVSEVVTTANRVQTTSYIYTVLAQLAVLVLSPARCRGFQRGPGLSAFLLAVKAQLCHKPAENSNDDFMFPFREVLTFPFVEFSRRLCGKRIPDQSTFALPPFRCVVSKCSRHSNTTTWREPGW